MKVSVVVDRLGRDGWYYVATRGSHRQFKQPSKPDRVGVFGKPGDDLAWGTVSSEIAPWRWVLADAERICLSNRRGELQAWLMTTCGYLLAADQR